tara:strand:- start:1835 stop:1969 length:135 start_codon:yes stop_codon:yes gene_type:complete
VTPVPEIVMPADAKIILPLQRQPPEQGALDLKRLRPDKRRETLR